MLAAEVLEGRLGGLGGEDQVVPASARPRRARAVQVELEADDLPDTLLPLAREGLHLAVLVQEHLKLHGPVGVVEPSAPIAVGGLEARVHDDDLVVPPWRTLPEDVLHRLQGESLPFVLDVHVHVQITVRRFLVAVKNVLDLRLPLHRHKRMQVQVRGVVPNQRRRDVSRLGALTRQTAVQSAKVQRQGHRHAKGSGVGDVSVPRLPIGLHAKVA
mmetsp:Transcript_10295/g.29305  ORF Transcript_10295/g.29305 Transcript_10295/m.29305 type:complete len:215 (-) Transcript_10295:3-647(-)